MFLKPTVFALSVLAISVGARAGGGAQADCTGTPPVNAVFDLPAPLSQWATIVCTPFGYIITNHDGWIWSRPASYSPVFIPAQMVRTNPKPLGQAAYFTKIEFTKVPASDAAAMIALKALERGMESTPATAAYRLAVTGSLGSSLVLYFFQIESSTWGVWCGNDGSECTSESKFMLMDMRKSS